MMAGSSSFLLSFLSLSFSLLLSLSLSSTSLHLQFAILVLVFHIGVQGFAVFLFLLLVRHGVDIYRQVVWMAEDWVMNFTVHKLRHTTTLTLSRGFIVFSVEFFSYSFPPQHLSFSFFL
jgi:hypothetical protein